jgi:hypothetical protein
VRFTTRQIPQEVRNIPEIYLELEMLRSLDDRNIPGWNIVLNIHFFIY